MRNRKPKTQTRKRLTMMVTVSVPYGMTPAEARREVKTLITDQCNYDMAWNSDDVKCIAAKPQPKNW